MKENWSTAPLLCISSNNEEAKTYDCLSKVEDIVVQMVQRLSYSICGNWGSLLQRFLFQPLLFGSYDFLLLLFLF